MDIVVENPKMLHMRTSIIPVLIGTLGFTEKNFQLIFEVI